LKRLYAAFLIAAVASSAVVAATSATLASTEAPPDRLDFVEVWAYLLDGEERFLDPSQPITDLGYFGAGIGTSGKLVGVPSRAKLPSFKGRVHLVVAELGNFALTHFCLDPEYPLRDALVADIVKGAEAYDGVQIDFEAVGSKDYENFYAFLALLKSGLGQKALSVALPAQIKELGDSLSYERIGKIADRIVVMAYDEHWSASAPGPVASIDWCRKISAYALSKVDAGKLVMGAPFYGRAWADKSPSRAYKYSSLVKLIDEKGIATVQRQGDIPFMEYEELVNVKVFFDDYASILARLTMYRSAKVRNIAFWRLGQEDPEVWSAIASAPPPEPALAPTSVSLSGPATLSAPLAEASLPPYSLP
jgi:spore germination protein